LARSNRTLPDNMSIFGIGKTPTVTLDVNQVEGRKMYNTKDKHGKHMKIPIFTDGEDVTGSVTVGMAGIKKFDHQGIRIELVGQIEIMGESGKANEYLNLQRQLEPPGTLNEGKNFDFAFNKVEKQYETYYGTSVKVRYFLKLTISRQYAGKISKELEFASLNPGRELEATQGIKMEVGIEECLHIEFEYNKNKFHLRECLFGKVNFLLVRIKLKYMELAIIKKEIVGTGTNSSADPETIAKFEVMDGCPVRGETIPIRLYLNAFDMTPTYVNVNNRFSVRYYINLILVDEEDRRYFKQQEITLWRRKV